MVIAGLHGGFVLVERLVFAVLHDKVFALVGFEVSFEDGDTKFERLAIRPSPARGRVRVEFPEGSKGGATNGGSTYKVVLQYAYMPGSSVVGQFSYSGAYDRVTKTGLGHPRETGRVVLQGFDIQYAGTSRFLEFMQIKPEASAFSVWIRDRARYGNFEYVLDYATVR